MIYASQDILEIRSRLLAITPEQWLLLTMGLIAGVFVWARFHRRIVRRAVLGLRSRSMRTNAVALAEGTIGAVVFTANAGLVYLATLLASFFLFAFGCVGVLMGAWITIPASFE